MREVGQKEFNAQIKTLELILMKKCGVYTKDNYARHTTRTRTRTVSQYIVGELKVGKTYHFGNDLPMKYYLF